MPNAASPSEAFCLNCRFALDLSGEPRCPECGRGFDPIRPSSFATARRVSRSMWRNVLTMTVVCALASGGLLLVAMLPNRKGGGGPDSFGGIQVIADAITLAFGCGGGGVFGFFLARASNYVKHKRRVMTPRQWQRFLSVLGAAQLGIALAVTVLLWFGDWRGIPSIVPVPLVVAVSAVAGVAGIALWCHWPWGRVVTLMVYWSVGVGVLIAFVACLVRVLGAVSDGYSDSIGIDAVCAFIAASVLLVVSMLLSLLRRPAGAA